MVLRKSQKIFPFICSQSVIHFALELIFHLYERVFLAPTSKCSRNRIMIVCRFTTIV